jgi:hypothetical protein
LYSFTAYTWMPLHILCISPEISPHFVYIPYMIQEN